MKIKAVSFLLLLKSALFPTNDERQYKPSLEAMSMVKHK